MSTTRTSPARSKRCLRTLRPHAARQLVVVFGCGGDRDRGKRPMMGEIATRLADRVIVTDDNPRSEVPAAIRAEILARRRAPIEIGDRAEAIRVAISDLREGDVLVIAGKGHETDQIVGDQTYPFDDAEVARQIAAELGGATGEAAAMTPRSGPPPRSPPPSPTASCTGDFAVTGVSIDSRTLEPGDLFVALQGPNFDGHDFVAAALQRGAAGALVHRRPTICPPDAPVLMVDDTIAALEDLGSRRARAGPRPKIVAVTGSVGKTSTKEALAVGASALFGADLRHRRQPQQPLGRAAQPRPHAARRRLRRVRARHEPCRRDRAAVASGAARMSRSSPRSSRCISSSSARSTAIADAKAEIFDGMIAGGAAVLTVDNPHFDRLVAKPSAWARRASWPSARRTAPAPG